MRISLSLLVTLAACSGPVESFVSALLPVTVLPPIEDTDDRCQNGIDDDGNGQSDCSDTKCKGFAFCVVRVDLRADSNRDGKVDLDGFADDSNEDTWDATHGAVFLANIDDDLNACPRTANSDAQLARCNDAADDVVNGDDDLLDMATLKIASWAYAPATAVGTLRTEPPGRVRLFRQVQGSWVLFDETNSTISSEEIKAGVEFRVEGKDIVRDSAVWNGYVNVTLAVTGINEPQNDTVRLRVSPVMLFHHLTPTETSYVTRVPQDSDSTRFVTALRDAISLTAEKAPLVEISTGDIWTEDFFETGYASMPTQGGQQHAMRVNFRSASVFWTNSNTQAFPLRTAGQVVFTRFRGRDAAGVQAYTMQQDREASSLNSYGNTETIPPYTNGGVSYPLGRVLRGSIASFAPDPVMTKLLESQAVQPAVYVDTSWLVVSHVDETISFVKANNARGWVLLLNDPTLAKRMLEAEVARGNGSVQLHLGKNWYDRNGRATPAAISISQVLANTDVMSRSAVAAAEINAQLEILKRETGVIEAEIIRVPFLHYTEYGASIAYQPGFVNGLVTGDTDFIAPDPFGPVIGGKDIFKKDFEEKLAPLGYNVRWVDDWDLYHVNLGEVHCATNTSRGIPVAKWWEGGR